MRCPRQFSLLVLLSSLATASCGGEPWDTDCLRLGVSSCTGTPAPRSFTSPPEALASYDGQSTCDPTAKPGVIAFRDLVLATYPCTTDSGIERACSSGGTSEHKEGRAWDWGINVGNPAADDLINWLLAPDAQGNSAAMARRLGIMYLIWNSRIWKAYKGGWSTYTGESPHTDHVHFSFSWAGANMQTSFWSGTVGSTPTGPQPQEVPPVAPQPQPAPPSEVPPPPAPDEPPEASDPAYDPPYSADAEQTPAYPEAEPESSQRVSGEWLAGGCSVGDSPSGSPSALLILLLLAALRIKRPQTKRVIASRIAASMGPGNRRDNS